MLRAYYTPSRYPRSAGNHFSTVEYIVQYYVPWQYTSTYSRQYSVATVLYCNEDAVLAVPISVHNTSCQNVVLLSQDYIHTPVSYQVAMAYGGRHI